jgi:energy-coupling factor transporter ATP-binding protein EcfA2
MLIEFRVENYRSFHQQQTLSMVASRRVRTHRESNTFVVEGLDAPLCKSAVIYGANASGKSNLVKAINFVKEFVGTSATQLNLGDRIPGVEPFRLDATSAQSPSRFGFAALIGTTLYEYSFAVTNRHVQTETLRVKESHKQWSTWLDRQRDRETSETTWSFKGPLSGEEALLRDKTRDNGLVLSRGAELNIDALKSLYLWFRNDVWYYDLSRKPEDLFHSTAARVQDDPEFRRRVLSMLRDADLAVTGLKVSESPVWETLVKTPGKIGTLFSQFRDWMSKEIEVVGEQMPKWFQVSTSHQMADAEGTIDFSLEKDESYGTQRFFTLGGRLLEVLEKGSLLVVDEFDASLHPLLTRGLVELFHNPAMNQKRAQLIFTTHDSTLMDSRLFRRDQVWLTEKKKKDGSTSLFSLDDFAPGTGPRNTESLAKRYLAGRYGGVPKLGPVFEDHVIQ